MKKTGLMVISLAALLAIGTGVTIFADSESGTYSYYNYDPFWYDSDDTLTAGEKAAYHYSIHHYKYRENWDYSQVQEQYQRIWDNPCHETAVNEMVWVEIPVWRLQGDQKVPGTTKV